MAQTTQKEVLFEEYQQHVLAFMLTFVIIKSSKGLSLRRNAKAIIKLNEMIDLIEQQS